MRTVMRGVEEVGAAQRVVQRALAHVVTLVGVGAGGEESGHDRSGLGPQG